MEHSQLVARLCKYGIVLLGRDPQAHHNADTDQFIYKNTVFFVTFSHVRPRHAYVSFFHPHNEVKHIMVIMQIVVGRLKLQSIIVRSCVDLSLSLRCNAKKRVVSYHEADDAFFTTITKNTYSYKYSSACVPFGVCVTDNEMFTQQHVGCISMAFENDTIILNFEKPLIVWGPSSNEGLHMCFESLDMLLPAVQLDHGTQDRKFSNKLLVVYEYVGSILIIRGMRVCYTETFPNSESTRFVMDLKERMMCVVDVDSLVQKMQRL